MRNSEWDGLPWCISEFSDPKVARADAKMLGEAARNGRPWAPTAESIARDEENRRKAREYLAKTDDGRKYLAMLTIRERQEQRLTEMVRRAEARILEKRKTG